MKVMQIIINGESIVTSVIKTDDEENRFVTLAKSYAPCKLSLYQLSELTTYVIEKGEDNE